MTRSKTVWHARHIAPWINWSVDFSQSSMHLSSSSSVILPLASINLPIILISVFNSGIQYTRSLR